MSTATAETPADSRMGSDDRLHHEKGFSFVGTVEKCAAARRSTDPIKNLAAAGERGVELHAILEASVNEWMALVEQGKTQDFRAVVDRHVLGLPPADSKSVLKIADEINVFFAAGEGLIVGTEELLKLYRPSTIVVDAGTSEVSGEVISFGWYDILLILGENALIVDHKFVRREIADAEDNRQGHCLATALMQNYPNVTNVTVLFSLPECASTRFTFTRTLDFPRLEAELTEILDATERPFKTLRAGEHCNYCKFRGNCPATVSSVKEMVTAIEPMSVPASFNPAMISTPEQMALLRHWAAVLEPVIEQIKEHALKMAQAGHSLKCTMGGDPIEFKLYSRSMPAMLGEPLDIWEALKTWLPAEAMIKASKIGIGNLETVAVQVLADRLIAEGKKPNATQIAKDFRAMLETRGLLTLGTSSVPYLKRVKGKRAPKQVEALPIEESARDTGGPESHDAQ